MENNILKIASVLIIFFGMVGGIFIYSPEILGGSVQVGETEDLMFPNNCSTSPTPDTLLPGWNESFDPGSNMDYCLYNESVFLVQSPIFYDTRLDKYFTNQPGDLYNNNFLIEEQGNVRGITIHVEAYFPSYFGQCLHNTTKPGTDSYLSPAFLLLANHQNGFDEGVTFDVAFTDMNSEIVCDRWMTLEYDVADLQNDFGSSFAGSSKTVGSFGFEATNMYVRDVKVIGTSSTVDLW